MCHSTATLKRVESPRSLLQPFLLSQRPIVIEGGFLSKPEMCGFFAGLLRPRRAFAPRALIMIQQKANIHDKPPKHNVGAVVSFTNVWFSFTVLSVAYL